MNTEIPIINNKRIKMSDMRFSEVKKEITRIANLESPKEIKDEIIDLDYKLNKEPKTKSSRSGNYQYFYRIEYFWDSEIRHGREDIKETIGKLPIDVYEKNKSKIDSMSYIELVKFLEENNGDEE